MLFMFCLGEISAQTASIRGFVYEKESGEPVLFTNVYLHRTNHGASTDGNGYFVISRIPAGSYTLMVTYLGYDTLRIPVTLKEGDLITKQLYLEKASVTLVGVNISAEREEARTQTRTSVVKVTPKEIKSIPSIGGTPDLAQYLQVLPGVIFTGDQGGQLYIRGGSPIQNKVLLDGMIVYNAFHSIGLFSVFDTDILRNADIYTGGFGAEHGGRISSVMDITTRDGNKSRIAGKAGLSTFGGKLMIEGPLKKETEGNGYTSFILSAKNSYLEQSSKMLYNYIDTGGLPFNFRDLYGKLSFHSENGSKVNFFGFNFTDDVHYKALSDFSWDASGAGANFLVIPGSSPVLIEGNFAYSSYRIKLVEQSKSPRTSAISGFNAGLNFIYFVGKDEIRYGIEMLGFKTDFDFFNSVNRRISQEQNTTEIAGFVKYKMTKGKLLFEPSFRLQYYASLSEFSMEPRMALKYNYSDKIRLKMAGGLYSQNLISATSDRDVVNLFYGFLSGPDNLPRTFDGKDVTSRLQRSQHLVAGVEIDLTSRVLMNLEAYVKNFPQLTNLNRNKIFDDNADYSDKPEYLRKDFIIENGMAQGIDLSLKYDYRRLYIWAVYSLAYIDRYDGLIEYQPHYDRRHNVNFVGAYTLGEDLNWEINARWNFGTGFPFTQSQGYYGKIPFTGGVNTDYTTFNEWFGVLYGELNKGRLPTYHRLDVTVKRLFELGNDRTLEAVVSVTNVYDRDNVFYFDRISNERVDQLPVMPSAGLTLSF
jgi:hypothetical protein